MIYINNLKYTAILFFLFSTVNTISSQTENRPNILWIVSEDNSPFLGCYGDAFASTPNLDLLAQESIIYDEAFASAPVCAPARSALITGMYPSSLGTENMRSQNIIPQHIRMFPEYLKKAGYYTTNNAKTDYNFAPLQKRMENAWNESSSKATYKNRKAGQPFFAVFNTGITHESAIHSNDTLLKSSLKNLPIPHYHPPTQEMVRDWNLYYNKISQMDEWVGQILDTLKKEGLYDNTIIFYYSDHGGVLGRSKRYLYDSGLKVPLIIRIPPKYAHFAPLLAGSRSNRLVSFVDFAPTVLNLAGLPIPKYMHGTPFLGTEKQTNEPTYAYGSRARMDERLDLSRTIRDKEFRYICNFMPQKIYGQYIGYMWKAPSMVSWEKEHKKNTLTSIQELFWQPKPFEELYDIRSDPQNINNLALNPSYFSVLDSMRKKLDSHIIKYNDAGLIPESMINDLVKKTIAEHITNKNFPTKNLLQLVKMAASGQPTNLPKFINGLQDEDPLIRYWAAFGCRILGKKAMPAKEKLQHLTKDSFIGIRIISAEALYYLNDKKNALTTLQKALKSDNRMVRLYALNALQDMGTDAIAVKKDITQIASPEPKEHEYDIIAANYLLKSLSNKTP